MPWADIVTIAVGGVFLLATTIALSWKIFAWVGQIYTNKDDIAKIDAKLDRLESKVGTLTSYVAEILAVLGKIVPRDGAVKSTSPLSLTDYGKEISQSVNAPELARRYLHKVDLAEATNAYEIQDACFNYARVRLLDELERGDKDIVQNYAFESGDNMAVVMSVIGIELRDTAFRNKGIVIAKKKPRAKKTRAKKKG